jgi:predicted Zn-dependent protease
MEDSPGQFTYTGLPKQSLRIHSSEAAEELSKRMQKKSRVMRRSRGSAFLKVMLVIVGLGILFYVYGLPLIAGKMANRFPIRYEMQLGDRLFQSMKTGFNIDTARTAYVNEFFRQLQFPSKYEIRITVVKENILNAFAMPGGHIVIYDKLLNGMRSYEELAALLSHEFTHVENRHTLRSLFRQFSSKIFLALLIGNTDGVSAVLVNNADQLKELSYSRSLETESDENGARLLANRNISCNGFVDLFNLFKKEVNGNIVPELVASHPNLDKRIENISSLDLCKQKTSGTDTTLHNIFLKIQTAD